MIKVVFDFFSFCDSDISACSTTYLYLNFLKITIYLHEPKGKESEDVNDVIVQSESESMSIRPSPSSSSGSLSSSSKILLSSSRILACSS